MKTVTKRLTTIVWYAAALSLSSAFAWKSRIKVLRKINPAGAGYLSFDPTRPANSLTEITTGDVLTLDATGIDTTDPATFFQVDNGEQPTPRPSPDTLVVEVPPGPARQIDFAAMRIGKPIFMNDLNYGGASMTTKWSVNGGPYVDYAAANDQIAALDPNTFLSAGPGYTLQPRVVLSQPNTSRLETRFILNY